MTFSPSWLRGITSKSVESLGTTCFNRTVASLFGTLFTGRVENRREEDYGVRVERFHIAKAAERDNTGLVRTVRLRLCDAKDSCGTVCPALRGLE